MAEQDPIVLVAYDAGWPEEFRAIGRRLRSVLGPVAVRIDHVGSTAVPGLDAKPVIDVEVSVTDLDSVIHLVSPLEALGFRYHAENPDRTKRFFVERDGERRTHLHFRRLGSFDEQLNLLFRDFLRTHPESAKEYAAVKWDLAARFRNDREGYVRAKEATIWSLLRKAHDWAQESGWRPGPSDA